MDSEWALSKKIKRASARQIRPQLSRQGLEWKPAGRPAVQNFVKKIEKSNF